jgi:hypothetical protein
MSEKKTWHAFRSWASYPRRKPRPRANHSRIEEEAGNRRALSFWVRHPSVGGVALPSLRRCFRAGSAWTLRYAGESCSASTAPWRFAACGRSQGDATDEPEAVPAIKEALYRLGQEALNNIAKHAGARAVAITLEASTGELVLRVRADGRGFDAANSFPGHLGLRSMRERAASVGGVIAISSAPGQGTEATIRVPRPVTA